MCLHWKGAKRFGSIFFKYCLCLWRILGFLGYLTGFFEKCLPVWDGMKCVWIQRKDLNLTDVNSYFAAAHEQSSSVGSANLQKKCHAVGHSWDNSGGTQSLREDKDSSYCVILQWNLEFVEVGGVYLCSFDRQPLVTAVASLSAGGCVFLPGAFSHVSSRETNHPRQSDYVHLFRKPPWR